MLDRPEETEDRRNDLAVCEMLARMKLQAHSVGCEADDLSTSFP